MGFNWINTSGYSSMIHGGSLNHDCLFDIAAMDPHKTLLKDRNLASYGAPCSEDVTRDLVDPGGCSLSYVPCPCPCMSIVSVSAFMIVCFYHFINLGTTLPSFLVNVVLLGYTPAVIHVAMPFSSWSMSNRTRVFVSLGLLPVV